MKDLERPQVDPNNPQVREMLARHAIESLAMGVYASYFRAVDVHHGGVESDFPDAVELQKEKSAFARSEYPLIPYLWLLRNEDGSIFQEMLEVDKIDPDTAQNPVVAQRTSLNGRHITDGRLLVAIYQRSTDEVWRNEEFTASQSNLLFNQAKEIDAIVRE